MLILSRNYDDEVFFYDKTTGKELGSIKVCRIHGQQVRLGFTFDNNICILRDKVINEHGTPLPGGTLQKP